MSKHLHIMAPEGAIAETVLLPGDPLRAKFIAENFLEDAVCYNEVRGMYGYTGTYKGKKVSTRCVRLSISSSTERWQRSYWNSSDSLTYLISS